MIETYDLEVFTPSCEPGAERFAAKARLKVDISEVLPYLNATLRGGRYYTYEVDLRVWKSNSAGPQHYSPALGFRCTESMNWVIRQLGLCHLPEAC